MSTPWGTHQHGFFSPNDFTPSPHPAKINPNSKSNPTPVIENPVTPLVPPFRPANADDANEMAELVNISGDGLPLYIWASFAKAGQTAWDVGRERARLGLGGFAYPHTVVRDVDGKAAACLIGYPPGDEAKPIGDDTPAPLAPLIELGNLVPDAWYLNVLATFPEHRGKGYAAELLRIAESRARDCGCRRMALIMSDANDAARRLYERQGFRVHATRPIVKNGWKHDGRNWVLMVRELT
mgnify:CR=1 FL=1